MTTPATVINTSQSVGVVFVAGLVLGLGGGLGFGWRFWRPTPLPQQTAAVASRQKDSSLVLQRAPDAHAKPQQIIPKGATVERVVSIAMQPRAVMSSAPASSDSVKLASAVTAPTSAIAAPTPETVSRPAVCPPVRVDLTLYRLSDKTERVVASSPDGVVLDSLSIDHPVANALPPPKARNMRRSAQAHRWVASCRARPREEPLQRDARRVSAAKAARCSRLASTSASDVSRTATQACSNIVEPCRIVTICISLRASSSPR